MNVWPDRLMRGNGADTIREYTFLRVQSLRMAGLCVHMQLQGKR